MKWRVSWELELEESTKTYDMIVDTCEEVIQLCNLWMVKESKVLKGEVIAYLGSKPYADGKPCITFDIT